MCVQVLVGSAIVFCKAKQNSIMSVTGLIERDNDARRRLGMREIDGTVGVDLLSGMHIRMYVCMYVYHSFQT